MQDFYMYWSTVRAAQFLAPHILLVSIPPKTTLLRVDCHYGPNLQLILHTPLYGQR